MSGGISGVLFRYAQQGEDVGARPTCSTGMLKVVSGLFFPFNVAFQARCASEPSEDGPGQGAVPEAERRLLFLEDHMKILVRGTNGIGVYEHSPLSRWRPPAEQEVGFHRSGMP